MRVINGSLADKRAYVVFYSNNEEEMRRAYDDFYQLYKNTDEDEFLPLLGPLFFSELDVDLRQTGETSFSYFRDKGEASFRDGCRFSFYFEIRDCANGRDAVALFERIWNRYYSGIFIAYTYFRKNPHDDSLTEFIYDKSLHYFNNIFTGELQERLSVKVNSASAPSQLPYGPTLKSYPVSAYDKNNGEDRAREFSCRAVEIRNAYRKKLKEEVEREKARQNKIKAYTKEKLQGKIYNLLIELYNETFTEEEDD